MTNDFLQLSKIGKRSSCESLIFAIGRPENLEGIAKKSKLCGRPNLKGNMLAVRRSQNVWQRTGFVGSEYPEEVRNHKKLFHSRRSLQSVSNAIPRVHYPDGGISSSIGPLQFSEQYYTDARNENKPFACSRSRYLEHAQNTVGSNGSKYCKDALVKKKDRETLARTPNGGPSIPAREIHWRKILRRVQQWNSRVYIEIARTLASETDSLTEPCAHSKSGGVRTSKVSERKRGFPMSARKIKPRISPSTMRGSKESASLRKSKVWKPNQGRLHRAGYAPQTPSRIETRSSLSPFKSAGFKQLYPLVLRRSQIRLRLHLSEGRRFDRVLPVNVLRLGCRRAPWLAKREKAAIVLQAQWRMFSARHSYQNVRRASLTIRRQWRETKHLSSSTNSALDILENETSIIRFMKSDICSETNGPHDVTAANSAAASESEELTGKIFKPYGKPLLYSSLVHWKKWRVTVKEPLEWYVRDHRRISEFTASSVTHFCKLMSPLAGRDNQRSLKLPELSVELLYDSNISATQEDEIFDEFLSFLPCPEFSSADILTTRTGTRSDHLPQSHSLLLEEMPLETPHSPNLVESSSTVLGAAEDLTFQCSPSTKPWNNDMYNLDSPACSPVKELTFARISIDGSLPPTPITEWSSRQRDPMERSSAVQVVRDDHNSTVDVVELHHSPTKDWASPLTRARKPSLVLVGSPHSELNRERFQLPNEWFMDLDELDIPESCWDTSKVTSISFSPHPSDIHLKPLHGFTGVPFIENEMEVVSSSRALICIPEESAPSVSSIHENRNCSVTANPAAAIEKSLISVKLNDDPSLNTIDRETAFSDEDVDGSANVPTEATYSRLDSSLSPALEEELLDELTKLLHGSLDPPGCLLDISNLPASRPSSTNDLHCSEAIRPSHPKALSRVCSGTLGKDGFSGNSARKLNFNIEDEDGLSYGEENQGVCDSNQEACDHNGGLQVPGKSSRERMLGEDGKTLSLVSVLPKFTPSESVICASQISDEILDGNDQKHFGIYEMLDDLNTWRDSQSYSKRCQSTVTDFLLFGEEKVATGVSGAHCSLDGCFERCVDRSPRRSSSMPQSPKPLLPSFEDEDDFCDKAVDGNIVVVKDSSCQVRGLLPDPFRASIGWEAALATEVSKEVFGSPTEPAAAALDTSLTRNVSTFVTPKMQRSCTVITRSCGSVSKTKPPLPMKSRRISFDHINYKSIELFIPAADEKRPLLPEQKDSEKLLNTSPGSPHPTLALYTSPLGYQERSSAISVSKKYFLQSPSSRMQLGKSDSDTEGVVSPASSQSMNNESSLEGVEEKASAKHARALFTCQESALPNTTESSILKSTSLPSWNDVSHFARLEDNYADVLKHRASHRLRFPGGLSGPLLLAAAGAESDCSFRKSTSSAWDCGLMTLMSDGGFASIENSSPSLHDLCKVWEEESTDLLTRSLKYKSLMTDPDLLRQELAFEKTEPSSPQTVAWEIQNIERSKEKLESRERLQELIRQQRNTIYINIATNASMRERYRLYSKWGIRRMSRARLRKVIYELLWNDPKRYHASADLVLQYL